MNEELTYEEKKLIDGVINALQSASDALDIAMTRYEALPDHLRQVNVSKEDFNEVDDSISFLSEAIDYE